MRTTDLNGKTILVTGSPGFIGAFLVCKLRSALSGGLVISLDDMNSYYDPALKEYRLDKIERQTSSVEHIFIKGSIADKSFVDAAFERFRPEVVVNLAAQAGVRYSENHPDDYINTNIVGFFNILEACRRHPVEHLIYASSSSVYGGRTDAPFSTDDAVDRPVSLYAATKKADELLAHSYASLYSIPCTGLRFFTVYGPQGRPDMFYYSAAESLVSGGSIRVFNYGECLRDFTYIDDIVEGVFRVMQCPPVDRDIPYALYNIGGGRPVLIKDFLKILESELVEAGLIPEGYDFEAHKEYVPMQAGDVLMTCADTAPLERDLGFVPETDIYTGLKEFVKWYREYRCLNDNTHE